MNAAKSILFLSMFFPSLSFALEDSRPQSEGKDHLLEVTIGQIKIKEREVFEAGFDYEYFFPNADHHFSLGVASEIEFLSEDEYYLGPLFSLYYFHYKLFVTSGLQTNFSGKTFWKNRLGLGYEIFVTDSFILIPGISVDRSEGEYHRALTVGAAIEF